MSHVAVIGDEVFEYASTSDLPREVAVDLGRELGISPIAFIGPSGGSALSIWEHLEVLADAAAALGYIGAEVHRLAERLMEFAFMGGSGDMVVALMPGPLSHKSAPPGAEWLLHAEGFVPSPELAGTMPLRLAVSSHVRNHHDSASRILLWDDAVVHLAHREASAEGFDAALMLNADGRIASVESAAILVEVDDRLVTPPLSEGAVDTAWRRHLIVSGEATEAPLTLENVMGADAVGCLFPWGQRRDVGSLEAVRADGRSGPDPIGR